MMVRCGVCEFPIEQELSPAIDWRSGKAICDPCHDERREWRARLVFPDPVRLATVPNQETW